MSSIILLNMCAIYSVRDRCSLSCFFIPVVPKAGCATDSLLDFFFNQSNTSEIISQDLQHKGAPSPNQLFFSTHHHPYSFTLLSTLIFSLPAMKYTYNTLSWFFSIKNYLLISYYGRRFSFLTLLPLKSSPHPILQYCKNYGTVIFG